MKIAFWSPLHGTGTTSSMLAVAIAYAELENKKVLLTQTHYNLNNLEQPLIGDVGEEDFFRDIGIDAVLRHFKSGNITKDQISDCTIQVGRALYLLAGTRNSSREGYESSMVKGMLSHIFREVEKYYDIVFIDTNSGENEYSLSVSEECDAVVILLDQNLYMLDSFFENDILKNKNIFYLFADYDSESKYSLKNLSHKYKKINKYNSARIMHSAQFSDAISDKKVFKFITEDLDCDSYHTGFTFFSSLKDTVLQLKDFIDRQDTKKPEAPVTEESQ
ncbi:MAG: hypothetical protein J5522_04885 [Lachnospiraceae bacterium]|nr:hypothetical protein [Lachnospiraceae bacterium]